VNGAKPEAAVGGQTAAAAKPEKKRGWRPWRRKGTTVASQTGSGNAQKDSPKTDGPLDEGGFPLVDVSKPKDKPKPNRDDPIEVDDGGFPVHIPNRTIKAAPTKKERKVMNTSQYTSQVDYSTPESLRDTLSKTADLASLDASALDDRASELRKSAADCEEKPGMREGAENMRREAAQMEMDAEQRRGMAAGFANQAADVAA
jgi:hypothetical protein